MAISFSTSWRPKKITGNNSKWNSLAASCALRTISEQAKADTKRSVSPPFSIYKLVKEFITFPTRLRLATLHKCPIAVE